MLTQRYIISVSFIPCYAVWYLCKAMQCDSILGPEVSGLLQNMR